MTEKAQQYREEQRPLYREVKRKAAVGERIKIVAAEDAGSYYKNGDVLTVSNADRWAAYSGQAVSVKEFDYAIRHSEYVVLEPLTSDPLYAGGSLLENFRQFVADNAPALRKLLDEVDPEPTVVTATALPKLTRADVIAKARADVAELIRIGRDINGRLSSQSRFRSTFFTAEFHVNRDKRTVTALVSTTDNGGIIAERNTAKFTAKCSPSDVFHAEIGKAIALRRALGLTVPDEYVNAPKPDEPRKGAIANWRSKLYGEDIRTTLTKRVPHNDGQGYGDYAFLHTATCGWIADKQYEVIDDTDVDYSTQTQANAA